MPTAEQSSERLMYTWCQHFNDMRKGYVQLAD